MRVWVSGLIWIVVTAAAVYGLIVAAMVLLQDRLLFLPDTPSRVIEADPEVIGLAFEPVTFHTVDGISLEGWYVPAVDPRGVVLFFHGNAGNISHRLNSIDVFNKLGLDTLIFDYRGYGSSEGRPSEAGLKRDAEAAWRYLTEERGVGAGGIILFGRSLGAAVAAGLAADQRPAGLILESGFVSVPDLGARLYPWLPVRLLSRLKFPTADYLGSVSSPVLVIHSRGDEIIPFAQGEGLFAAARDPKRFVEIEGGHNDGFLLSGPRYRDALNRFLAGVL